MTLDKFESCHLYTLQFADGTQFKLVPSDDRRKRGVLVFPNPPIGFDESTWYSTHAVTLLLLCAVLTSSIAFIRSWNDNYDHFNPTARIRYRYLRATARRPAY